MKILSELLTLDLLKRLVIDKILQRKTHFTALSDMHGGFVRIRLLCVGI